MIQVHVAVKAVEVRVLSRAHKKTPSDAAKRDLRAFLFCLLPRSLLLIVQARAANYMQADAAKETYVGEARAQTGQSAKARRCWRPISRPPECRGPHC